MHHTCRANQTNSIWEYHVRSYLEDKRESQSPILPFVSIMPRRVTWSNLIKVQKPNPKDVTKKICHGLTFTSTLHFSLSHFLYLV